MPEELNEWVLTPEEEYDNLIPVYKKRRIWIAVVRFIVTALTVVLIVNVPTGILFNIIVLAVGGNAFFMLYSKERILTLQITIMQHIRAGTIDQFLE